MYVLLADFSEMVPARVHGPFLSEADAEAFAARPEFVARVGESWVVVPLDSEGVVTHFAGQLVEQPDVYDVRFHVRGRLGGRLASLASE